VPPVAATTKPVATATATATHAPTSAPPANCDPPYVIDSKGHRQYKPQCL